MQMELETQQEGNFYIIKIKGELEASSSIQLDDAIQDVMDMGGNKILFDCLELSYISSPGIGVFTSRIEDHEEGTLSMALYGMNDKVFNVFKILGLDKLLPIVTTKDEAKPLI
ncbi:MAG: STAS domain-containing protein [Flammeovirgaceae bacterium]|nr:STAS domain-containing protein [Flammeovirgaceae bacterium]